jgi:hypothetical protein
MAWCISPGGDPSIGMPFPALRSHHQRARTMGQVGRGSRRHERLSAVGPRVNSGGGGMRGGVTAPTLRSRLGQALGGPGCGWFFSRRGAMRLPVERCSHGHVAANYLRLPDDFCNNIDPLRKSGRINPGDHRRRGPLFSVPRHSECDPPGCSSGSPDRRSGPGSCASG